MKTFLKLAFVAGFMISATPSFGQLYIGLGVRVGPPPPRHEVMTPRPHRGWVWVAGYYTWHKRGHRYVWTRGHWARPPRSNAVWIDGRWEQRKGEWVFVKGRWDDEHHHGEDQHRDRRDRH